MSYVPQAIPSYLVDINDLKYPRDTRWIRNLSLDQKQMWYAAQDPQELIQANTDFHSFWYWNYVLPLKIKRFFYLFKFW